MTSSVKTIKRMYKRNIKLTKKYGFTNVIKKIFAIIAIAFLLITSPAIPNTTYANDTIPTKNISINYQENYSKEEIQNYLLRANNTDWQEAKNVVLKGETFKILDPMSGTIINMKRTGGHNHYDVETVSKADTDKIISIWGGFSWERKGFILITNSDDAYIISMHGMPHAGTDDSEGGEVVSARSCNYGKGVNYDFVKDNGMNGHVCIHFKNSKTHCKNKVDYKHQNEIIKLQQLKNKIFYEMLEEF